MFNFPFNIVVMCTAADGMCLIGGDHGGCYKEAVTESEARTAVMQIKSKAITVIGLITRHAVCDIISRLQSFYNG